jgi:hyperosmotically inducible protein
MPKILRTTAVLLLVLLLIPALTACRTPAGRSAGQVVDDATIQTKVKAKLFDNANLSGFAIDTDVFQGQVTLTGAVENQSQKQLATEVAQTVEGVTKVNNLLKIKQARQQK